MAKLQESSQQSYDQYVISACTKSQLHMDPSMVHDV
jgi:hypothetical protein